MFLWVYDVATRIFLYGGPYDAPCDPATQGRITVARHPKPRTERYDEKAGIRPATAQEIADYDARRSGEIDEARFNGDKLMKAVVVWVAGKQGMTAQAVKAEIMSIYRGL